MEKAMKTRLNVKFAGLTATLFAGVSILVTSAFAGDSPSGEPRPALPIEYGKGLVCHTQEQAEQLVARLGTDIDAATSTVNAGEHDGDACGIASLAFVRGGDLETVRNKDATFQIVEILVVGVETPKGFQAVVPAVFVALRKVNEYAA
jgi:hypothetical protein